MKRRPESLPKNGGTPPEEPIAIVSFGGVFPGARSLDEFWRIIEAGVDTSRPVPPGRWILDPKAIQDPTPGAPDSVYTDRGCFIDDFPFDPVGLDLPPGLVETLDPSFHLLLEAGRGALSGARIESVDRGRVGVILGNIALPTDAASDLCRQVLGALLEGKLGRPGTNRVNPLNRYVAGLPAGLLAQALRLGGGSRTLDAACASSLYAVKLADDELRAGRADAMLAGGLSRPDSLYTQMGFCQLHALARTGRCAPFDAAGSGLIVGEGAGVLVLKRLSDALRDGDAIHALVCGAGLSNDLEGNLLSPDTKGQLRALHQAYRQAGWSPDQVDLIECHATGTPVGDAVEFESLSALWRDCSWRPGQCVLGAVKANIGHLLTAAGSASLIKVLLALKHNTLPPTANFQQPGPKIALEGSPFQILSKGRPWERRGADIPRRAAVNGFGFGGINAHLLIEEWIGQTAPKRGRVRARRASVPIAIVGMAAQVGRWTSLEAFQRRVLGGGEELPERRDAWRGVPLRENSSNFAGYYMRDLEIPVNRYRIPPKELGELLPQQALMLEVARQALRDARLPKTDPSRTGVFIGLGLDLRATDFHYRWSTLDSKQAVESRLPRNADLRSAVSQASGLPAKIEGDGFEITSSRTYNAGPPLTADRTLGALAGTNASRIAKEFHFGGPSYTVCGEDCSGTRALELAVRALQQGDLDQALAGGVDLTGDPRAASGTDAIRPYSRSGVARPFDAGADGPVPGEGAVGVVLKRLDDARRDGDRIYAVIRGVGSACGAIARAVPDQEVYRKALERAYEEAGVAPESVGYVEADGAARPEADQAEAAVLGAFFGSAKRKTRCPLGSAKADVGHTGAASGLVSVVKAALALYQEILPPLRGLRQPLAEIPASLQAPLFPQYWARNRADGPRRAGVSCSSVDGNVMHLALEACEEQTGERPVLERIRPLGARSEALFVFKADDPAALAGQFDALRQMAGAGEAEPVEFLARRWWLANRDATGARTLAIAARDAAQLFRLMDLALAARESPSAISSSATRAQDRDRLFYPSDGEPAGGKVAFVFPGAGGTFPEMGRELAVEWPRIARVLDAENLFLAGQICADQFWNATPAAQIGTDHRAVICGQVALGALTSDLAVHLSVKPQAALGYSLGESTGLFALRAWTARDEMLRRVSRSTLFTRDLTGSPERLRRAWGVPRRQAVEWQAGLLDCSAEEVRAALGDRKRLYVLIVNTPGECVVGGDAAELRALVKTLGCHWFPLEGVSTVHCELLRPVERAYRELHLFETRAPAGIAFYSGGWGRVYQPDRETAADAIVAQAGNCIDFPRVVRAAYDAGVRVFLEMGPGNSCSRMIGRILEGRPHLARSVCASAQEPLLGVLRALGELLAWGVPVDLARLFEGCPAEPAKDASNGVPRVRLPISGPVFARAASPDRGVAPVRQAAESIAAEPLSNFHRPPALDPFEAEALAAMAQSQDATLTAHQAYLDFSKGLFESLSRTIEDQFGLISSLAETQPANGPTLPSAGAPAPALDRAACLEFARGSVAKVLGPEFAPVDSFPTRVRLPDEPLMLVDRIMAIEGEARSMTHGRVITEHDIRAGAWYLDYGRIPTCIAVEAGQADLFLSGYLGIDFQTKGKAVYRLLDAKVCFHRGLPGAGSIIHYDIHIDRFFRQGDTWLFRFHFEATVGGERFLTMTDGCAGFFSAEELAGGKGVVRTTMDLKPMAGKRPADWEPFVAMETEFYSAAQLDALRAGNLAGCFGARFGNVNSRRPATLPGGRMKLVHRIERLEPEGGRFGLGLIRGEADIHPDDWFLTCHFVDDRVMPGTLMFECCLHTLRVFLLRLGWVVEQDQAVFEPVPGIASQLKCRGQVLETTAKVTYEVSIKELGYRPEPYVIADALMYADGKAIVEITNMSLRYAGVTRETLAKVWRGTPKSGAARKPALYDTDRILAFAVGKPSEAFGEPYRVFDGPRRIARLPGPPYQFLDRITEVQGEPFRMVPGGLAEAEYDIPPDAWYFTENRQGDMPFAVLLEIALQPCGWLAAYAGSALTSETDLSFRNLGGAGTQFIPVFPDTGTLTTRVKMTRASSSAGMIIQWYDFEVRAAAGLVYKGDTYFGFFPAAALARQEGIRDAALYQPGELEAAGGKSLDYPVRDPFPGEQLRMVDHIGLFLPEGGPNKLGFIRAVKRVRPEEWFFKAHFHQDPVVPGSLGLESFLQLLKFLAIERWGRNDGRRWEAVAMNAPHEWIYRGQIIPADRWVTVEAVVTAVDPAERRLTADGFLSVDGRVIYGMKKFSVRLV